LVGSFEEPETSQQSETNAEGAVPAEVITSGTSKMTSSTSIAKLTTATDALRTAFESHGTEWNEKGKTLVNFQKAEQVINLAGSIDHMGTIRDGFQNFPFAIAKAAPLVAEIAATRAPCDLFFGDDSDEDVTACEEVSLALCDFVACFDKSDEDIAAEISDFIKEKDGDFDSTREHTIAGAWDKGTNPDEIELMEVENVLDLALEDWAEGKGCGFDSVREPALMYLNALRSNTAIMEILAIEWLEIIRAQWTAEEA
jgi:hypothetical protein